MVSTVAQAAMDSGAARRDVDLDVYRERLEAHLEKSRERIWAIIETLALDSDPKIIDPGEGNLAPYAERLYELRRRRGVTRRETEELIQDGNYLGSVMVEMGDADAMLAGLTHNYPSALRPPLQVIGTAEGADLCGRGAPSSSGRSPGRRPSMDACHRPAEGGQAPGEGDGSGPERDRPHNCLSPPRN